MSDYQQPPQQPPPKSDDFQKGFKMMLGGCAALLVAAVVVVGGLFMLGAISLSSLKSTTNSPPVSLPPVVAESNQQSKSPSASDAVRFAALSPEEKLRMRLAGVENANKTNKDGSVTRLTGPNQDIITITAPIGYLSNEGARVYATSFIDGLLRTEHMTEIFIALGHVSIVVTDGKRTWTKILKTGELIENSK